MNGKIESLIKEIEDIKTQMDILEVKNIIAKKMKFAEWRWWRVSEVEDGPVETVKSEQQKENGFFLKKKRVLGTWERK